MKLSLLRTDEALHCRPAPFRAARLIGLCWGLTLIQVLCLSAETLSVNVRDFGALGNGLADDTGPIQEALKSGRTIVELDAGIYRITRTLIISSNTHLKLSPSTVIRRSAGINAMLLNSSNGAGGYEAASNIEVSGGIWDGNSSQFGAPCTLIVFGHARDVLVRDTSVINIPAWHGVELSATLRARIIRVRFDRCDNEALQLDTPAPQSPGTFPWFGPYDDTKNQDAIISDCTFTNVDIGIGSHSNPPVKNLRIERCVFVATAGSAIKAPGYEGIVIEDSDFYDCMVAYSGASRGLVFRGNRVLRARTSDLDLAGVGSGVVEGNRFIASSIGIVNVGSGVTLRENFRSDAVTVSSRSGRVANLSVRTAVSPGNPVIFGIVVAERNKALLVRVAGPALRNFGVVDALKDPILIVRDPENRIIAENSSWDFSLIGEMARTGAFSFQEGSQDAALSIKFEPGAYTFEIRSATGLPGTVLLEVYDMP
jgi:hypothetical protein